MNGPDGTATMPTPGELGLSPLMHTYRALSAANTVTDSPLYYSNVSPGSIILARALVEEAIDGLRGLSVTINATCYDAEFDGPNAASEAVAVLNEALAALGGGKEVGRDLEGRPLGLGGGRP
jgi:hypothetical protein